MATTDPLTAPEIPPALDQAAQAIVREEGTLDWDVLSEPLREYPRGLARAALAAALDVEEMARVLIGHTRIDGIHGDCSCGHVVPLGHSFAAHQGAALRAALVGTEAR